MCSKGLWTIPGAFVLLQETPLNFLQKNKKPSGQERTAVERSYVAKATHRRRRILLYRILFHYKGSPEAFSVRAKQGCVRKRNRRAFPDTAPRQEARTQYEKDYRYFIQQTFCHHCGGSAAAHLDFCHALGTGSFFRACDEPDQPAEPDISSVDCK